jgi:hypothetical protein
VVAWMTQQGEGAKRGSHLRSFLVRIAQGDSQIRDLYRVRAGAGGEGPTTAPGNRGYGGYQRIGLILEAVEALYLPLRLSHPA